MENLFQSGLLSHIPVISVDAHLTDRQNWMFTIEFILERNLTVVKYVGNHLIRNPISELTYVISILTSLLYEPLHEKTNSLGSEQV